MLTFLLQVAFQCNEIFIEDKINLGAVALKECLQFNLVNDICGKREIESMNERL